MSTSTADQDLRGALGATLRRQLNAARTRAKELAERRRVLEQQLEGLRLAERATAESIAALEAVAKDALVLLDEEDVDDLLLEAGSAHAPADAQHDELAPALALLAGAELRAMAVRVALRRAKINEPVHWRRWYGWLRAAGYDAAGKRPENTFLTQLSRSPLVHRSDQDGVYVLELERLRDEQAQLTALHDQLRQLPPPGQTSMLDDLGDLRDRRQQLQHSIAQSERALTEMVRVLASEPPPGWSGHPDASQHEVVAAWVSRLQPGPPGEQLPIAS
jgi:hypothetical protein